MDFCSYDEICRINVIEQYTIKLSCDRRPSALYSVQSLRRTSALLDCCYRGFESQCSHRCLSPVFDVCCLDRGLSDDLITQSDYS
jgi:hypothetical protein